MPKRISGTKGDIKNLANSIQKNMDAMYKMTYYTEPSGNKEVDRLSAKINANIGSIIKYNMNTAGVPSISKLYSRLTDKNANISQQGEAGDMSELFNSATGFDEFYSNFMQNKYLVEMDAEIDAVCRYFPDLLEALEIKKEGVLSADHFSKDFMTISPPEGFNETTFNERIKQLKDKYKLSELIEEVYDNAAKYGESFVYIVPYKTALSKLLTDKPETERDNIIRSGRTLGESSVYGLSINESGFYIRDVSGHNVEHSNGKIITESTFVDGQLLETKLGNLPANQRFNLQIEMCHSGVIESAVIDAYRTQKSKSRVSRSMSEAFLESVITEDKGKLVIVRKDKEKNKLVIDGMEDIVNSISTDGLIPDTDDRIKKKEKEKIQVDVPGCVVITPKRETVIPIYMPTNETCLGYYYLEFSSANIADETFQGFTNIFADSLTTTRGANATAPFNNITNDKQEEVLKYIAGELSKFIDKEFVQSNQDLRDEIYNILKYNDLFNKPTIEKIRITYVPPEDMVHVYFKLDKDTHRGVSDLIKAMVPGKIYACMYITDAIGHMVRGQDKRVFHVRQQVDTNIAKVMMNTIQQLKQGNFGIRQFQSIDNVLNITGSFNDFLVPTTASGESPLQIDVIPGQQFTDNQEQKQELRELAVTATDVPFELIQTRQSVDYAMQLSMSNSRFMRKIFKRQSQYQPIISRIISMIYSYEYQDNVNLDVQLPPPMFLTMANVNQLVDNTKTFIQSVTEFELADEEDEKLKAIYTNELFKYYIGTQIDLNKHEMVLKRAMALKATETIPEE